MESPSLYITQARSGLRLMISSLGLSCLEPPPLGPKVSPPGAIFVSIDFEGGSQLNAAIKDIDDINIEFGVAFLDPLYLDDGSPTFNERCIKAVSFVWGSSAYITKASKKFLFGETRICRPSNFLNALFDLLPQDRPIVFVVHTVYNDRAALLGLGFDMRTHPRVAGVVDIWPLSGDVFHASQGLGSLERIMTVLKIHSKKGSLHCAGNDAHYTLQCALLLAERGYQEQCPCPGAKDLRIRGELHRVATIDVPLVHGPVYWSEESKEYWEAGPSAKRARQSFKAERSESEAEIDEEGVAGFFELETEQF